MATIGISGNNCYTDLHIYTDAYALPGSNEHYYNSLQHTKAPAPASHSRKALLSSKFFKNSKFLAGVISCVVLVVLVCSLSVGYVIGKGASEKRERQRLEYQDATRFRTITGEPLSTTFESVTSYMPKRTTEMSISTYRTVITTGRISTVKANLDGKTFRIYRQTDQKHWHYDGCCNKFVSGIWQPKDKYTLFKFIKMSDGSFKIQSVPRRVYMFDGYGVKGARSTYLNGMDNIDDGHMRFLVTMETLDTCRIRTKATGRYLRMDKDLHVTSILNIKDRNSLFRLDEVQ
ncbi:uncharacterized protein LOC128556510 [Mercenaria mercenaria]|uniref:uncharacterized protein LOC128556510 n=1 Tax=Mercenaria mercenaria TaxID=6596 RepID=UPI00234ED8F6|nr:uncharacterized protein LOC128556510 [Mercenaria mercenaria]